MCLPFNLASMVNGIPLQRAQLYTFFRDDGYSSRSIPDMKTSVTLDEITSGRQECRSLVSKWFRIVLSETYSNRYRYLSSDSLEIPDSDICVIYLFK